MAALGSVLALGGKIVDAVFHTKSDRDKFKKALAQAEIEGNIKLKQIEADIETTLVKARADAVAAEAKSDSWLASNWRPIVMLGFFVLVLLHWLGLTPENLPQEEAIQLMDIIQVGLAGYVVGQSAEVGIRHWKAPELERARRDNT